MNIYNFHNNFSAFAEKPATKYIRNIPIFICTCIIYMKLVTAAFLVYKMLSLSRMGWRQERIVEHKQNIKQTASRHARNTYARPLKTLVKTTATNQRPSSCPTPHTPYPVSRQLSKRLLLCLLLLYMEWDSHLSAALRASLASSKLLLFCPISPSLYDERFWCSPPAWLSSSLLAQRPLLHPSSNPGDAGQP